MMHRSHSISIRTHLRSTSLLCLGSWLSLPLGLGVLSLNQRAQAIDLESPTITESAPITPAAPPVDTFIDPPNLLGNLHLSHLLSLSPLPYLKPLCRLLQQLQ